jgi:hypothetical protein
MRLDRQLAIHQVRSVPIGLPVARIVSRATNGIENNLK